MALIGCSRAAVSFRNDASCRGTNGGAGAVRFLSCSDALLGDRNSSASITELFF